MNHASKSFTKYAIISIIVIVVLFIYHSSKLEFARFYKRCTGRTKSAMGACSQSADFRTGCIARQRDMSMKRSVMRMAPHYDNIFSCIGCFFVIPNIHPILPYTFIRNWGIFSYFNNFPIVLWTSSHFDWVIFSYWNFSPNMHLYIPSTLGNLCLFQKINQYSLPHFFWRLHETNFTITNKLELYINFSYLV